MNPIWLVLILPAIPVIAYLAMKFGVYGYYKGKTLAERKEVEPTASDNRR